jgi:hypothetical protein
MRQITGFVGLDTKAIVMNSMKPLFLRRKDKRKKQLFVFEASSLDL